MTDQVLAASVFELLTGSGLLVVAFFAWNKRQNPAGVPLVVMAVAISCWALASGLQPHVPSDTVTHALSHATHLLAALAALAWFYVAVEYTDTTELQGRQLFVAILSLWVVDFVLVVTDPVHMLFTTPESRVADAGYYVYEMGPLYAYHLAYSLTLMGVGIALFARAFLTGQGIFRRQTGIILVGAVLTVPFILLELVAGDLLPVLSFHIVGMAVLCLVLLWTIFRADFLETVSVSRDRLYENMVKNIDDYVVALDASGNVVDANPKTVELLATDSPIGMDVTEAFERYPRLGQRVGAAEEGRVACNHDEDQQHFELTVSPVRPNGNSMASDTRADGGVNDETLGHVTVIRDITDQVREEQELESQRRELEAQKQTLKRQNERLDKFASMLSHDIRNPLGVAEMYLDFARESGDQADIAAVNEAHERMEKMVQDLLTVARSDAVITETEWIPLVELIRTAWNTAETTGVTLELTVPDDVEIEVDPEAVQHVFENLFRNTADHNEPPLTVVVGTLGPTDEPTGLFVEDNGSGIPNDERENVFDHGYTTAESGTGFGLSIVAEFVDAHGWEINATSGRDGGARFEIHTDAIRRRDVT